MFSVLNFSMSRTHVFVVLCVCPRAGNQLIATDPAKARAKYALMLAYVTGVSLPPEASLLSGAPNIPQPAAVHPDLIAHCRDLELISYANTAQCWLQLNNHANCIKACNAALAINPEHTKTLYRRAKASYMVRNISQAHADLEKLSLLGVTSAATMELRRAVDACVKADEDKLGSRLRKALQ
jgi:tetratricopeptide (TPR) repeat protein